MNKYIVLFLVFAASVMMYAQESEENTLFGNGKKTVVSGYGAPEVMFSQIKGSEFAVFVGGRGGAIFNHSFILGGGGYGLVTSHHVSYSTILPRDVETRLMMGFGGLHLGYVIMPSSVVHFTVNALIGAGGASTMRVYKDHDMDDDWNDAMIESTPLFAFLPSVGVELNMVKFFRVELSVGYRLISGSDMLKYSNSDLSGFYGGLALKFGKF